MIELMVAVAIVAILVALAAPSFSAIIQRNRIAGQVNSFVGDLQFARSEAIKRGQSVSLCPSSNGTDCLTTNTWHSGWIVFNDTNGSGAINGSETPLRYRRGFTSSDTFAATTDTATFTYNREGFANVSELLLVMRTAASNANATRCVLVNRVGRQQVQSNGTGSCA
jgi:type IV fimbrial biogenesis protein FimT